MQRQLAPWQAYRAGHDLADVLVVKAQAGPAESAGGPPFSGADGAALTAALPTLGWGDHNWCGLLLAPPGQAVLAPQELRLLLEICDPLLIITLDAEARECVWQALTGDSAGDRSPDLEADWPYGTEISLLGRQLLALDDFETALASAPAKQRVWLQLKKGAVNPLRSQ